MEARMALDANIVWKSGLEFSAHLDGFSFAIDAAPEFGGANKGPRPKGLTLVSLAGCTGLDVISILKKMRITPDYFEVAASATVAETHPKRITTVLVRYIFKGQNLPADKIAHAVELSETQYCGVSATLRPGVVITSQIEINGQVVAKPA
jgi:putative redox protein